MEVVLIVVGAILLVLIGLAIARKQRERRLEGRREEAGELRQTAQRHDLEAARAEAEAEESAARAKSARTEAVRHQREAAEVDPDAERSDAPAR
jgi:flagellar biosynthesis/type III secretory pathway M-ring protein FliF/YscJ